MSDERTDLSKDPFDERKPWDRQEGEPVLWFSRFEKFCKTGPKRSLTGLYNHYRNSPKKSDNAPQNWREAAKEWNWRGRAAAWDLHELEKQRSAEEALRKEERKFRVAMLQTMRGKVLDAIQHLKPAEATWKDTTAALGLVTKELRTEFDDEPATKHELSGVDGKPITIEDVNKTRELRWQSIATKLATALVLGDGEDAAEPQGQDDS